MKLCLYKYELEKDALVILNKSFAITDINSEAKSFFDINEKDEGKKLVKQLSDILSMKNLKSYLDLALSDEIELTFDTNTNKKTLIKSGFIKGEKQVSILVSGERERSLNSLIDSYIDSEKEALIYFDIIKNELSFTESFLSLFDLEFSEDMTFFSFLYNIMKRIENKKNIFNLLTSKLSKFDEFLGIIQELSGQKIEFVYKKYEFGDDLKGILCNFTPIDREIVRINYDQTTELLEKKVLIDEMKYLFSSNNLVTHKMALFLIDINDFKDVNDLYGLKMGDYVLKKVGRRIKKALRAGDLVGRFSGDKFIALANGYDKEEDLEKISNRILKKISLPIELHSRACYINANIGVTKVSHVEIEDNIKDALCALRYGKEKEINISYFNTYLERILKDKLALEEELKEAIKDKDFYLHYQPQISYRTGNIVGVEALVRWKNKRDEIVGPNIFIPIAEELGLIKEIEAYVLQKALYETKQIREKYNIKLAINLSNKHFNHEEFINILETYKDSLDFLELEITESTAILNIESTLEMIKRYKKLGISIAIDDFGIGYSSLSHLKYLPIDKIKIDKSFVDNIINNRGDEALVKAVLLIAESIGVDVIAEGVENEQQLEKLRKLGCDTFQGYYFEKPLSIVDIEKELNKNNYKIKG